MARLQHTKLFLCIFFMLLLAGCGERFTTILQKKADYKEAEAKFSSDLFFNNDVPNNKRIFVQIRNLTCQQFTEKMQKSVLAAFKSNGYKIVNDPMQAGFLLQANIVQCDRNAVEAVQHTLDNGYGGAIEQSVDLPIQQAGEELDENVILSIVADLQISEQVVSTSSRPTYLVSKTTTHKPWKQYQTRLAITKSQLRGRDFNSSAAWLIDKMATAVVGIFAK